MHALRALDSNFPDTKILVLEQKADTALALCSDLVKRIDKNEQVCFFGNINRKTIWFFYVYTTMSMISLIIAIIILMVVVIHWILP